MICPVERSEDAYQPPFDVMKVSAVSYEIGGQFDENGAPIATITYDRWAVLDGAVDADVMQAMARIMACSQDVMLLLLKAKRGESVAGEAQILAAYIGL